MADNPRQGAALLRTANLLALIATNEDHGLMWTSEGTRREGPLLLANFTPGTWFWVDFAFGASLILAGAALLVLARPQHPPVRARAGSPADTDGK